MALTEDAAAILMRMVDHLKERGVRSFKGDLLAPDGSKLWNVDLVFERPSQERRHDRDPME